jgi:hypothetical protein
MAGDSFAEEDGDRMSCSLRRRPEHWVMNTSTRPGVDRISSAWQNAQSGNRGPSSV